jgi:holo-[acyl-carrier protein] synthase
VTGGHRADPPGPLPPGVAADVAGDVGRTAEVVGVGIDAVDLDRFARVLARRRHLADRLFTEGELTYARSASDPLPRLSTRFAAKEATMKCLGVGLGAFPFHDVEVVRTGLDAPRLVVQGRAAQLALGAGVTGWHLSLTHTDHVAMAVVVASGATRTAWDRSGTVLACPPDRP